MKRIAELMVVACIAGALLVAAFQLGRLSERQWWRSELAMKSASVKATMKRLGLEAEGLDRSLLRDIGGDRARLEDAEAEVRSLAKKLDEARKAALQAPPDPAQARASGDDACKPQPARCLRPGG
jgi:hypothetical protein